MQETPDYPNLQQRFLNHTKDQVQGQPPNELATNKAELLLIDRIYEILGLYFNNSEFRSGITIRIRQNTIESYISNILNSFDQVVQNRTQGTLQANKQGIIDAIQDQEIELEKQISPFITRDEYVNSLKNSPAEIIELLSSVKTQSQKTLVEIENIFENVQNKSKKLSSLVDKAVGNELGDYFHLCYNGRTIKEQEELRDGSKISNNFLSIKNYIKTNMRLLIVILILFMILAIPNIASYYSYKQPIILNFNSFLDYRFIFSAIIGFVLIFSIFVYLFNKRYAGGYEKSAAIWFTLTLVAIAIGGVIVAIRTVPLIDALKGSDDPLEVILANLVILAIPAYAIRVCIVNYNANKHQAVLNLHRVNVLRTFPLILTEASGNNDEQTRNVVYAALADSVFRPGATGHINRGQASDNSSQNSLKDLLSN